MESHAKVRVEPAMPMTEPRAIADAIASYRRNLTTGTLLLRFKDGRLMQIDKEERAQCYTVQGVKAK